MCIRDRVLSSNPEAYALERAKRRGVPAIPLSRKQLGQEPFEAALMEALTQYRVDLVVLAGFLSILSADFVRRWPDRIVNVHPSLIPAFCGKGYYGLKVHEAALRRGVRVTGATVHLVNEIPDGGRILLQKAVDILPGDTPETLQRRVMEQAEWVLLGMTPDGKSSVAVYFIMGRSANSRNRVFAEEPDGIRTQAADPARMEDPSLIIYHPVRQMGRGLIVTNGDQTDTILEFLKQGLPMEQALRTREFEPDGPNWTPRISGLLGPNGSYKLSILKAADGSGRRCLANRISLFVRFTDLETRDFQQRIVNKYSGKETQA